jgi:L-threonylcarbamoyladenylate synthase
VKSQLAIFLVRVVKPDLEGLTATAEAVAKGGVICYPTDTVYGLGCDPFNVSAIAKAISVKGKRKKVMPVLVTDDVVAERLAYFSPSARKLANRFWPGPLTIVLPARDDLPSVLAPQRTVGVRSPKHAICQQLLRLCSGCLVGTSANITGKPPAVSVDEIVKQLGNRVDVVLDGGRSLMGVSSTVVDLTETHIRIVREGPIGKAEVLQTVRSR